ncbi:MAG: serine protein kinase RIO [Candidatus Lokiarchaeota archaeon]|nr:serine protein kinase RIO [Candidatus Lokiarchaeota archaeon]
MTDEEDDLDEELTKETVESKLYSNIDALEKQKIDNKRIRLIDDSKRRSTLNSVFDERTIYQLTKLEKNGPLIKIEGMISAGKEANVYLGYDQDGKEVAIKIYKIDNNTSKWMRNYIVGDPRFKKVPHNISKIIFLWASKEYKNLKRAHKVGLRVPKPIFIKNNILIMEYIGDGPNPAPRLKDIKELKNISLLFEDILSFIKNLYQKANLVHGDLSEFNILYNNQYPVVIDVSQAVTTQHPKAEVYLARDIKNVFTYFGRIGLKLPNPQEFYFEVIKHE